jgi:hypothetical protein
MRNTVALLMSALVVGLMSLPSGVTAQVIECTVYDQTGDLGCNFDAETGEANPMWTDNVPWAKCGCFDMTSFWLIQDGTAFTFGMQLAADLPDEGDSLAAAVSAGEWGMWVESEPWNLVFNPVDPLYLIALVYDGSHYDAYVMDYVTKEKTPIEFEVDGSVVRLWFSVDMIGGNYSFYWGGYTLIYRSLGTNSVATYAFCYTDLPDWGAVPYQEWYDIPWPYPPI